MGWRSLRCIPLACVRESGNVLGSMEANADTLFIPGTGHGIVAEQAAWLRGRLNAAPKRADRMEGKAMNDLMIDREEGETKGRYSVTVDGVEAELTYSRAGATTIIIDHTGVPDALRGRHVGLALVRRAVEDARSENRTIVPLCPFAKAQIARHPEWHDVLKR